VHEVDVRRGHAAVDDEVLVDAALLEAPAPGPEEAQLVVGVPVGVVEPAP
jgi:hypothetical protein